MRTITKQIEIYGLNELSEEAKKKAINNHIEFLLNVIPYEDGSDNYKKAIDKAQSMYTPWFTGSYIWEYCKEEIEADLDEHTFLKDGSLFNE